MLHIQQQPNSCVFSWVLWLLAVSDYLFQICGDGRISDFQVDSESLERFSCPSQRWMWSETRW